MQYQICYRVIQPFAFILLLIISGCAKDVEVCVNGDMSPDTPGQYTYTWCGENAEFVEWQFNGTTYAGETITLDLNQKQTYFLTVKGRGKKKESTESYTIDVGAYEVRVEPMLCTGDYLNASGNYKAYLYQSKSLFQSDFRNNIKTNCLDSVELSPSYYYAGTISNDIACLTGSFNKILANGDYVVYVLRTDIDGGINNLSQLFTDNYNLTVLGGASDDVSSVSLNTQNSVNDNKSFNNLLSKTYKLTAVWVNGTSTGVSTCNSDDELIFNLDNTWSLNVGADDCGGSQYNSSGNFAASVYCQSIGEVNYYATTSTGTMPTNFLFVHTAINKIKITAYDGVNTVETEYTAQ